MLPEDHEFGEMRHGDVTDRRVADVRLFVFIFIIGHLTFFCTCKNRSYKILILCKNPRLCLDSANNVIMKSE